jgi:hypothetical protein
MNKEFIPYEQALELKELGFDEPCFAYYETNKLKILEKHIIEDFPYLGKNSEWQDLVAAPTFSQAFRWFRDKYNIHQVVNIDIQNNWYFEIFNLYTKRNSEIVLQETIFNTYEEAELACLNKLIKIVKEKK